MPRSITRVVASLAVASAGALAACGDEKTAGQPAPSQAREATKRAADAIAAARTTAAESLSRAQAVCDRAVAAARAHSQQLADRTEEACRTSLRAGRGGAAAGARAGEEAARALEKALDDLDQVGER